MLYLDYPKINDALSTSFLFGDHILSPLTKALEMAEKHIP